MAADYLKILNSCAFNKSAWSPLLIAAQVDDELLIIVTGQRAHHLVDDLEGDLRRLTQAAGGGPAY